MKLLLPLSLTVLFSGCAQYATVTALKPSESSHTAHIKTLAVGQFEQDTLGLSQKLQVSLSNLHPYFTVVSQRNSHEAFVRGSITAKSVDLTPYTVERSECIDKECHKRRKYQLTCINKSSTLNALIQIVDSKDNTILFASNEHVSMEENHCLDDSDPITSDEEHFALLSDKIAQNFADRLVPSSVTYKIELMDKCDRELTSAQNKQFESTLNAIEENRPDRGINALQSLSISINSYVVEYDMGVAYEMMGQLEKARVHYQTADAMITQSSALINNALNRIEQSINDKNAVALQIKQ